MMVMTRVAMEAAPQLRRHHSFGNSNGYEIPSIRSIDIDARSRPRSYLGLPADAAKPNWPQLIQEKPIPRANPSSPKLINQATPSSSPPSPTGKRTLPEKTTSVILPVPSKGLPTPPSTPESVAKSNGAVKAQQPTSSAIHHIELPRRLGKRRLLHYCLDVPVEVARIWESGLWARFDKLLKHADIDALGSASVQVVLAGKTPTHLEPRVLVLCSNKRQRKSVVEELNKKHWDQLRCDLQQWCIAELILVDALLGPRGQNPLPATVEDVEDVEDDPHMVEVPRTNSSTAEHAKALPIPVHVLTSANRFRKYVGIIRLDQQRSIEHAGFKTTNSQPSATIGGIISVDGQIYGLSVGHPFMESIERPTEFISTGDVSEDDTDADTDYDDKYWDSLPGDSSSDYGTDDADTIPTGHPQASVAHHYSASKDTIVARNDDHIHEARILALTIGGRTLTVDDMRTQSIESRSTSSSDWCLVALPREALKPNKYYLGGGSGSQDITKTMDESSFVAGEVSVMCPNTGLMRAQLGSLPAVIYFSGLRFNTWPMNLPRPLKHGDSGSWVLMKGRLCGILIAGSESLRLAYMLPIEAMFESIRLAHGAQRVCLPTAHDVKLARKTQQIVKPMTHASSQLPIISTAKGTAQERSHELIGYQHHYSPVFNVSMLPQTSLVEENLPSISTIIEDNTKTEAREIQLNSLPHLSEDQAVTVTRRRDHSPHTQRRDLNSPRSSAGSLMSTHSRDSGYYSHVSHRSSHDSGDYSYRSSFSSHSRLHSPDSAYSRDSGYYSYGPPSSSYARDEFSPGYERMSRDEYRSDLSASHRYSRYDYPRRSSYREHVRRPRYSPVRRISPDRADRPSRREEVRFESDRPRPRYIGSEYPSRMRRPGTTDEHSRVGIDDWRPLEREIFQRELNRMDGRAEASRMIRATEDRSRYEMADYLSRSERRSSYQDIPEGRYPRLRSHERLDYESRDRERMPPPRPPIPSDPNPDHGRPKDPPYRYDSISKESQHGKLGNFQGRSSLHDEAASSHPSLATSDESRPNEPKSAPIAPNPSSKKD